MSEPNYLKDANLLPLKNATSKVWKFFGFKHTDGVISDNSHVSLFVGHRASVVVMTLLFSQVYCAIANCDKRELKYCGNTTNLGNHLKSKHLSIYRTSGLSSNDRSTRDRENDDTGSSSQVKIANVFNAVAKLPSSSKKAKQLTDAVGYFIAKDMQPISVVQGSGFKHMLYCLEPRYQVPHRKTFMERVIPDLYKKVKASVIPSVTSADCYAITTDCWTSCANEAYIGVTFHTITTDWDLQHFVLENEELSEQHTAENLAEALTSILKQWKLEPSKLSGATVDNAANVHKAVADILSWKCLGCFGHTINLCVKAGLNQSQVHTAVARCSRLVTFFRKSSRAAHVLSSKQDALGSPKHKLLKDVETRWNSTYDMVERVMEQQEPICATLIEQKRLDLLPKDTEFHLLEEVLKVLKPFKDITVQVSGENYVTISSILPLLDFVSQNTLKVTETDSLAIQKMKQEMTKNLESRYKDPVIQALLKLSSFVDPRFKSLPFLDEEEAEYVHDDALLEMMKYISPDPEVEEETTSNEPEEIEPPPKKAKTAIGKLLGGVYGKSIGKKRMSIREKAEKELRRYLEEPVLDIDDNVLEWWKKNHTLFPSISVTARQLMCIPATSTPSERLFSKAGNIITKKRASLDPENASLCLFPFWKLAMSFVQSLFLILIF